MVSINEEVIKNAYRKYKSFVYFNKYLTFQREKIIDFEDNNFEKKIKELAGIIEELDDNKWKLYKNKLLQSIQIYMMPKSVSTDKNNDNNINFDDDKVRVNSNENLQAFINADVEVQVLGTLWIFFVGKELDKHFYEHSYANRLIEYNDIANSNSPYLFKPYFNEYERWRDRALKKAEELHDDNNDSIFISLDIKRFYYSVDIPEDNFLELTEKKKEKNCERINEFVLDVIKKYSELLPKEMIIKLYEANNNKSNVLPLGFMPSSIIANWYLDKLDKAIIEKVKPVYYGRYVDDIIIVDKVEEGSNNYALLMENSKKDKFVENYLKDIIERNKEEQFYINKRYTYSSTLYINKDKINVIPVKHNRTKATIEKLRENIRKNSSEFRMLPEDKDIFLDTYNKMYILKGDEDGTKIRDVKGYAVDKYELSKFIGKQLLVGAIVNDYREDKFYEDIAKIFTNEVILNNYITWESILTLCVINKKIDKFFEFIKLIKSAIFNLILNGDISENNFNAKCFDVKKSLESHLFNSVCRASCLMWGSMANSYTKKLTYYFVKKTADNYDEELIKQEVSEVENKINKVRDGLTVTRMINKLYTPILIDFFIDKKPANKASKNEKEDTEKITLKEKAGIKEKNKLNKCTERLILLSDINSSLKAYKNIFNEPFKNIADADKENDLLEYKFYPYKINYEDLYRQTIIANIYNGQKVENDDVQVVTKRLHDLYEEINTDYKYLQNNITCKRINENSNGEQRIKTAIKVGRETKNKLKIAVGNAHLNLKDFHSIFIDKPNRSIKRYNDVVELINQAIKEEVDLLILPENYLPFEWLENIQRKCRKEQIGLITGIEHVVYEGDDDNKKYAHNLIATILPFKEYTNKGEANEKEYKYIYTNIRDKIKYSPDEVIAIEDYGYNVAEGNEVNLFVWNNIWFPVYCCFEIASTRIRNNFLSLLDLVVVVEWNKDVEYFSNIIDSLSRDMHAYCVQVNSAHYGDSCIVRPTHSHSSSIVRTSGGINNVILVGEVDVSKLREFQVKGYVQQKQDDSFKRTPPDFERKYVKAKINNELFEMIEK